MNTIAPAAPVVNSTPAEVPAEEYRPSFDFSYYPDLEEERDAREMFADEDGEVEPDWDALAEDSAALDRVCSGIPWL